MMRDRFVLMIMLAVISAVFAWEQVGPLGMSAQSVMPDPISPDTIYAIVSGGVSETRPALWRTIDAGVNWDSLGYYEGGALHPATAETIFATLGGGSFSDGIWRSNDYGRTFEFPPPVWLYRAQGVVYHPLNPSILFGWGSTIDRSLDGGRSWETVYSSITTPDMFFTGVRVDPVRRHRVYAWNNTDRLFFSDDMGDSWRNIYTFPETMSPNDIVVAHDDSLLLYAACWGGLAISRDGGFAWELLPIEPRPSNCIWVSEFDSEHIIIGGAYGVLSSEDGGVSWGDLGEPLPCAVFDFAEGPALGGGKFWYVGTDRIGILRMHAEGFYEGPVVGRLFPPDGSWIALDDFDLFIELRDPDGVDETTLEFFVNGTRYDASSAELWLDDSGMIFSGDFADGETLAFSLTRADDRLGNPSEMLPMSWTAFIDRSSPTLQYRSPGIDEVVPDENILAKFFITDEGSGVDTASFIAVFGEDTIRTGSIALLFDADTIIIHLPSAGIAPSPGDTINVMISIRDKANIGSPNELAESWSFSISPTNVPEADRPCVRDLHVFPNPFNAMCTIVSNEDVRIFDINGNLVQQISAPKAGIALWDGKTTAGNDLPSGIYLIRSSARAVPIILLR